MAIGTLAMCYNNIEVFRGVVKMRRGKISINGHAFSFLLKLEANEINKLEVYCVLMCVECGYV